MTLRNMEVALTARTPVLSVALLARVHEFNRDYVELLALHARTRRVEATGISLSVLDSLLQLSNEARARLAASPFALYSLGFEDQTSWLALLDENRVADRPHDLLQERYSMTGATTVAAFCEMALFFSWHTAMVSRVASRVLFAMPDALAARMVQKPLWKLRRIAAQSPGLLQPRWPNNPAFWPDLVRFAAAADWRRLETAQLLGSQLIAAELDAAMGLEGNARGERHRKEVGKGRGRRQK